LAYFQGGYEWRVGRPRAQQSDAPLSPNASPPTFHLGVVCLNTQYQARKVTHRTAPHLSPCVPGERRRPASPAAAPVAGGFGEVGALWHLAREHLDMGVWLRAVRQRRQRQPRSRACCEARSKYSCRARRGHRQAFCIHKAPTPPMTAHPAGAGSGNTETIPGLATGCIS
jgi:hypothetical protein